MSQVDFTDRVQLRMLRYSKLPGYVKCDLEGPYDWDAGDPVVPGRRRAEAVGSLWKLADKEQIVPQSWHVDISLRAMESSPRRLAVC